MWRLLVLLFACASAYELQPVSHPMSLGEGPHWSPAEQALYFVEIKRNNVWRYHPESGNLTTCYIPEGQVSVIVPLKGESGKFAVGVKDNLRVLTWDGKNGSRADSSEVIVPIPTPEGGRTNDGKIDAAGRMWIGTIGREDSNRVDPNAASLFRVECKNGSNTVGTELQVENVTVSNGIAWSADGKIMYYVDSPTRQIDAFDYEPTTAAISNRRTVFKLDWFGIPGVPDGMTIDKEGNLWVALYGGESVIVVKPQTGQLLTRYMIPGTERVTSVAWGGPNYDVLFITSSSDDDGKGGHLYTLTGTGASGRAAEEYPRPACNNKQA